MQYYFVARLSSTRILAWFVSHNDVGEDLFYINSGNSYLIRSKNACYTLTFKMQFYASRLPIRFGDTIWDMSLG